MDGPMRQRLEACLGDGTKADRALAAYILARPETIPFESAATLAEKVGVSEATVGRFCRSLGYDNLKDLKQHLGQDIGERPWLIADRLRDFQDQARASDDPLGRSLELEMAGLVAVYEIARSAEFRKVVERLTRARRVFVCGFQTERASSGKQVEDACPLYLVGEIMCENVEQTLTRTVGGGTNSIGRRCYQRTPPELTADDPHRRLQFCHRLTCRLPAFHLVYHPACFPVPDAGHR